MNNELNWGILGLGHIAKNFTESIMAHGKSIYGVAARDEKKAETFARTYGIKESYSSYQSLVEDEAIDVVYIASVNSQHYDLIKLCLTNGKHVLCEKAIWHHYNELLELEELAKKNGLILAEAMTIFHMPLMKKLKQLVQEGAIGSLQSVQADFGSLKEDDPTNRFFSKEQGGGAMLDIGTYALSFVSYFIQGNVTKMEKIAIPYAPTGVDERWSIGMATDENILGNVTLSFRSKLPKRALIVGVDGYFEINDYPRGEEAILVKPDGKSQTIQSGNGQDGLYYEFQGMEEAIHTKNSDKVFFELTKQTIKWMDTLLS